jgi:hypothetical protein
MDNISKRASLVSLKISTWTGRCVDKKVSADVLYQHNATEDCGRFSKRLLPKEALKDISAINTEARKYYKEMTLAWEDGVSRLLPVKFATEFEEKMREFDGKLDTAVTEFINNYQTYKTDAQTALNGLYNEGDYPSLEDIEHKFKIAHELSIIADPEDFRCEVSDEVKESIQSSMRKTIESKYTTSMKKLYERIHIVLNRFNTTLANTEAKFNKSLVENIQDLVALLPDLNFMDDQNLTDLTARIKEEICNYSPTELRSSSLSRDSAVKKSAQILDTMSAMEEMYA